MRQGQAEGQELSTKGRKSLQIYAALVCNLGAICLGMTIVWVNPIRDVLKKDTGEEALKWIGSLMFLGASCVTIPMFFLLDKLGRKIAMLILVLPYILCYVGMAISSNAALLCVARFFAGFASAGFSIPGPIFVGEISEPSIRGFLGFLFQLGITIGIALCFAIGLLENQMILSISCMIPMIIFFVLFLCIPESPVYLASVHKDEKAKKSLAYYRGKKYDVDKEMSEIDKMTSEAEARKGKLKDNMKRKSAWKSLLIGVGMFFCQQFSGINVVLVYSTEIFRTANIRNLKPGVSSVILGVVQALVTAMSAAFVDKAGRKILTIVSLAVMAASLIVLGVFFFIKADDEKTAEKIGLLALISMCIYLMAFSVGLGPVPWLLLGEMIPTEVKPFVASVASFTAWFLGFVIALSYEPLLNLLGASIYFVYAVLCVLGIFFILFIVPETKGKTLDEIVKILEK